MSAAPKFDMEPPPLRVSPTPRWIRVRRGDEWIADSHDALLCVTYGPGRLPTYAFREQDLAMDAVAKLPQGVARQLGDGDPAELAGMWTFAWDGRVRWFEEAEEVFVHARDPQHRVDVLRSERHVVVALDGETLAESREPRALFETGLPTRWYVPADDVRLDLLEPSDLRTRCPYKGLARFLRHGDTEIAWVYDEPIPECPKIAGLVCFFNEHVDLTIGGQALPRPFTPWSTNPSS
jgi:uncharacterized protein (DUF427 family)